MIIKRGSALLIEKGFWRNSNVSFMLTEQHLVMSKTPLIGLVAVASILLLILFFLKISRTPPTGLMTVALIPLLILFLLNKRETLVIPIEMLPIERSKFDLNKFVASLIHEESGISFDLVLNKVYFDTFAKYYSLKELERLRKG